MANDTKIINLLNNKNLPVGTVAIKLGQDDIKIGIATLNSGKDVFNRKQGREAAITRLLRRPISIPVTERRRSSINHDVMSYLANAQGANAKADKIPLRMSDAASVWMKKHPKLTVEQVMKRISSLETDLGKMRVILSKIKPPEPEVIVVEPVVVEPVVEPVLTVAMPKLKPIVKAKPKAKPVLKAKKLK